MMKKMTFLFVIIKKKQALCRVKTLFKEYWCFFAWSISFYFDVLQKSANIAKPQHQDKKK